SAHPTPVARSPRMFPICVTLRTIFRRVRTLFSSSNVLIPFMLRLDTLKLEAKYMTKADLVDKVTRLGDLTRRDGEIIVETIFDSVISALHNGDKIEIRGFGSFRIRQ